MDAKLKMIIERESSMRLRAVYLAVFLPAFLAAAALTVLHEGAAAQSTPADDSIALSDAMTRLQVQHAKLWFAGKLSNWALASYEIQKIDATLDAAGKLLPAGGPIRNQVTRTKEQLEAVRQAVRLKDLSAFTKTYSSLTNECNGCHRASGYASIAIQLPAIPPVPNQLFVDQVSEGQALARASCGSCHVVADAAKETPASRPPAPGFPEIVVRSSFSADAIRQFLSSGHRRIGPAQAMPNPRLTESQIEAVVAYLETLRADRSR